MPDVIPPLVMRLPSMTILPLSGIAPNSRSSSRDAQWVVARRYDDDRLFACARWIMAKLGAA